MNDGKAQLTLRIFLPCETRPLNKLCYVFPNSEDAATQNCARGNRNRSWATILSFSWRRDRLRDVTSCRESLLPAHLLLVKASPEDAPGDVVCRFLNLNRYRKFAVVVNELFERNWQKVNWLIVNPRHTYVYVTLSSTRFGKNPYQARELWQIGSIADSRPAQLNANKMPGCLK